MIDKKNFTDENIKNTENHHQLTLFVEDSVNGNEKNPLPSITNLDQKNDQQLTQSSPKTNQDMALPTENKINFSSNSSPLECKTDLPDSSSTKISEDLASQRTNQNNLNLPNSENISADLSMNDDKKNLSEKTTCEIKIEADFKNAKNKALELLERFGFDSPPVDPIIIANELGINVRFVKFNPENKKISGFFYAKRNEIFVNEEEDIYRQVFTIAHELGHKLLHQEWLKTNDYQVLWRDASLYDANDIKEKEANCFAANLLVPKAILKQYYQVANVEELSVLFGVSRQVITYRLKNEGFTKSGRLYD